MSAIATGDLALNLMRKFLVATLETQRARFLRRDGSKLLVVDGISNDRRSHSRRALRLALRLAPPQNPVAFWRQPFKIADVVRGSPHRPGSGFDLPRRRPVPLERSTSGVARLGFRQTKKFSGRG